MKTEVKLTNSNFFIKKNCGIDYKFITDWCIENENHPFFREKVVIFRDKS